jgi:hypothetical protein
MRLSEYFEDFEFHCRCGRRECDAPKKPTHDLVAVLTEIRRDVKKPLRINSGIRCRFWNAKQGGVAISGHIDGSEADIACSGSRDRYILLCSALRHGVPRIGIADSFVHIGMSANLDRQVAWLYGNKGIMGSLGC